MSSSQSSRHPKTLARLLTLARQHLLGNARTEVIEIIKDLHKSQQLGAVPTWVTRKDWSELCSVVQGFHNTEERELNIRATACFLQVSQT